MDVTPPLYVAVVACWWTVSFPLLGNWHGSPRVGINNEKNQGVISLLNNFSFHLVCQARFCITYCLQALENHCLCRTIWVSLISRWLAGALHFMTKHARKFREKFLEGVRDFISLVSEARQTIMAPWSPVEATVPSLAWAWLLCWRALCERLTFS